MWLAFKCIRRSALRTSWLRASRTPFSLATQVPERRLEFHVGKMSLPDYLDINSIGSDSHLQFMNWTVDNNGAWDYAADTRGYTYAAIAEYDDKDWSARYALALMPTVANGIDLDWNLRQASGQNWEFELRKPLLRQSASGGAEERRSGAQLCEPRAYGALSCRQPGLSLGRGSDSGYHEARDVRRGEIWLRLERGAGVDFELCAPLRGLAGTRGSTSRSPIPKWIRRLSLAGTIRAGRGRGLTTSLA